MNMFYIIREHEFKSQEEICEENLIYLENEYNKIENEEKIINESFLSSIAKWIKAIFNAAIKIIIKLWQFIIKIIKKVINLIQTVYYKIFKSSDEKVNIRASFAFQQK